MGRRAPRQPKSILISLLLLINRLLLTNFNQCHWPTVACSLSCILIYTGVQFVSVRVFNRRHHLGIEVFHLVHEEGVGVIAVDINVYILLVLVLGLGRCGFNL